MSQLPPAIRVAAARHHAERAVWDADHPPVTGRPPQRGDLVIANNGEGGHGVVLVVAEHDTHLNVLWTHSTPEMAYDADIVLPARTAALWPSVICTELYGQIYPRWVTRVIAHLDLGDPVSYMPRDELAFVKVAAVYAGRLGGTTGTRLGGMSDPRRDWMSAELDDANRLSAPLRHDLIGWAP